MSSDDLWNDPKVKAFLADANAELLPKLQESALSISIAPDAPDPKFAIELGYIISLDKPLILVVWPDRMPSAKLLAVADEVVRVDPADDEETQRLIQAAIDRVVKKLEAGRE